MNGPEAGAEAAVFEVSSISELVDSVGRALGPTGWMTVSQELVDAFARLTEDEQWIHVDVERARTGPFGGTVAHGYLLEALIPRFSAQMLRVGGVMAGVNMGSDRVRFLRPVVSGSRIRARGRLGEVTDAGRGWRVVVHVEIEREGDNQPALIAETIRLLMP